MHHIDFWEAGYRVFPLYGKYGSDGLPLPDKEQFKKPRASGYQHSPVWSDEQFDLMEKTDQFDTGYGVLCHGLLVVDIDARNGGIESWDEIKDIVGEAGLEVATGSGGGSRHLYFKAPEGVALVSHVKDLKGIDFKASGFIVGPGSLHASGSRYTIIDGSIDAISDAPASLIDLLRKPERHRASYNGDVMDVSHEDIKDMLSNVSPDCDHETWIQCGMAAHEASQGTAFDVWDDWSAKGASYPGTSELEKRWHSFGKSSNPVTIGTLIYHAEQGGWKQSVTFETDTDFGDHSSADPLDISHIDLLRPPGLVGEVKQWIDDQCRYPREHLSTAAALVAVGNVIGLRYTDDIDGATGNLFAFGVADSASGKEAVLQACQALMVSAGISAATHGMQKSQQEVMRNLIRHQAAYYLIDEFGIELKKVVNAQKRGSAAYLEGLIGALMSAYSKADGKLLLSGDVKEDVRKAMIQEKSGHDKAVENNEDKTGIRARKSERLEKQLVELDQGLDKPFLSMIGFTTPSTFDEIIDEEQATSGFLGRALLVREHESNPRPKRPFKKRKMPEGLELRLHTLFHGGEYDAQNDRVEYHGERISISTTEDAKAALDAALDWTMEYAETQKERSGLEPVVRRGYEMVAKVSLVLAAAEGVRTLEHVRWSYALVRRDVDEKLRLVMSNDKTHGADKNLMAKITKIISKDHGETIGVIRNRLRSYKPDDVQKALDKMIEGGAVIKKEAPAGKGKKTERYYFTG
jgi:hypothetical protein